MDLRDVGKKGKDWIGLVEDTDKWWALVNKVLNLLVPKSKGKFFTS